MKGNSDAFSTVLLNTCRQARITDEELKVIKHRLWCRWSERKSSAEIANLIRMNRDRVLDLEESALDKLRDKNLLDRFSQLLSERRSRIWKTLSQGRRKLPKENLKTAQERLSPEQFFLLVTLHGSVENWLNREAEDRQKFWRQSQQLGANGYPFVEKNGREQKKMDLRSLQLQDIPHLTKLIQRKEKLMEDVEKIDQELKQFE